MALHYNQFLGRDLGRLAALSDGVFAFALTLLAFDIRVPDPGVITSEAQLLSALADLGPRLVTYLLSFLTLGIFWNAQQTQLTNLRESTRALTWIQLTLLAAAVLFPFTTSVLAEFLTFRTALVLYWLNILTAGIALGWSLWYIGRSPQLWREGSEDIWRRLFRRRLLTAQSLYAVGALLCVFSTYLSVGFIVVVQLYYATGIRLPLLSRTVIGRS